jgi:hypothetical protein
MSWIDQINDKMIIRTADGVEHRPDWMKASFVTEYKQTEFNFIGVRGGLVKRKKAIGVKYNLEIYFQGANHLVDAETFRRSNDNTEDPWIMQHPFYGSLIVQPTTFTYDASELNATKITGIVIETMEEPPLNNYAAPSDEIPALKIEVTEISESVLTETPTPGDINKMSQDNSNAFRKGVPIISDAVDYEEYFNAFNTAATYIDTATATPLLAMRSTIAVLQMPEQFKASVQQRLKVLGDTFDSLRNNIFGLLNKSAKEIYTAQQAGVMAAICGSAATPLTGNFTTSSSVLEVIDLITAKYALFIEDLDMLQTTNASTPQSFVADAQLVIKINQLVNVTITNLFTIALGAQKERAIICEKDTNIIVLAHRVYGLSKGDKSDKMLNKLYENNDFGLDEHLIVPKGRRIVYYV